MAQAKGSIVIRRVKKVVGGGHHGGAWKVAYADFVTAMMAFFLVMWLVGSTTNKQKAAISEYFKQSSPVPGNSLSPNSGPNGPGGASTSMIKLGGTMELPRGSGPDPHNAPQESKNQTVKGDQPRSGDGKADGDKKGGDLTGADGKKIDDATAKKLAEQAERKRLDELMAELKSAIEKSQALKPFKDQLLLDITPDGLRIQIVDEQNRPMFDLGRAALKPYTSEILHELAMFINEVPNKISISGHTDLKPFGSDQGYTNWELSTDRANAARRALVAGGMDPEKVARAVGLSSRVLFNKEDPYDPINRRISIIVMTEAAEKRAMAPETRLQTLDPNNPDAPQARDDHAAADAAAADAKGHEPAEGAKAESAGASSPPASADKGAPEPVEGGVHGPSGEAASAAPASASASASKSSLPPPAVVKPSGLSSRAWVH
jgi:chemotaxis protein MotB